MHKSVIAHLCIETRSHLRGGEVGFRRQRSEDLTTMKDRAGNNDKMRTETCPSLSRFTKRSPHSGQGAVCSTGSEPEVSLLEGRAFVSGPEKG